MRHLRPILTSTLLILATALVPARADTAPRAAAARAARPHHVYLVGQLRIMQPWIDAEGSSPERAEAYLVVENRGDAPEKLTGASTEAADHVAIAPKGGDDDGEAGASVTIPPRTTVTLDAGDAHLVLRGLHGDVRGKSTVPAVLDFARAGPLHIDFATTEGQALSQDQTSPPLETPPASLVK